MGRLEVVEEVFGRGGEGDNQALDEVVASGMCVVEVMRRKRARGRSSAGRDSFGGSGMSMGGGGGGGSAGGSGGA